jgi:hypothetical protein
VNKLNYIYLTIIQRIKQAWLLPQTVAHAREHRRRWQVVRKEHESDRLDRLRNPSKYLGK